MASNWNGHSNHIANMNGKLPHKLNHEELSQIPDDGGINFSSLSWSQYMRELRHSPCLMTPLSALCLVIFGVLSLLVLIFQCPGLVIGLFVSQLLRRGNWFVEFLYPTSIARWGHILLLQWGVSSKMGGPLPSKKSNNHRNKESIKSLRLHSRAIEQRTEVVKNRVYIHSLPQFVDNIGYLIVCLPAAAMMNNCNVPIIGILVDCGDAESIVQQIEFIQDTHYSHLRNKNIQVQSILSTHKHHDHTAGNKSFPSLHPSLRYIFGGAVDRVPYCNQYVTNGNIIPLPKIDGNNMNDSIEIECLAVPAHTRGSIVYALRTKENAMNNNDPDDYQQSSSSSPVSYLFTGDTLFSAGAGVPFEADTSDSAEKNLSKKNLSSPINPTSGNLAMERCFAELLVRAHHSNTTTTITTPHHHHFNPKIAANQILLFPGHEYTTELIARQLDINSENNREWNKILPSDYFEIVSHFFISNHRRTLPKNSRLLTVPTPLSRELKINPIFRKLKKRGEHLLLAIKIWYKYFSNHDDEKKKNSLSSSSRFISNPIISNNNSSRHLRDSMSDKNPTTEESWNLDYTDANRPVFTTVYATDLDRIIYGLQNGTMTSSRAAKKLKKMKDKLDTPVVFRRPIPGTLPSEKSMYLGMLALAMLGSPPSALTMGDSRIMKLAEPVQNSDHLFISKSRLIHILRMLGLLPFNDMEMLHKINFFWETAYLDTKHDLTLNDESTPNQVNNNNNNNASSPHQKVNNYASIDEESINTSSNDLLELGLLKLTLYALPFNQRSWFSKVCLPCGPKKNKQPTKEVPSTNGKIVPKKRVNAELVKHDPYDCPMCEGVVGCSVQTSEEEESDSDISELTHNTQGIASAVVVRSNRIMMPVPQTNIPLKERMVLPNAGAQFQESVEMEVAKYYQR